jgi:hypothetical protein
MLSFHFFEFFKFWRENDVILLAPIFCLNVKTSLVNFSIELSWMNYQKDDVIFPPKFEKFEKVKREHFLE